MGLGHVARSTALAQAMAIRGAEVETLLHGDQPALELDGSRWMPRDDRPSGAHADLLVIDGYEIPAADCETLAASRTLWMHPPSEGGLDRLESEWFLDPSAPDDAGPLCGLACACLRRAYWSRAPREPSERVERILVTIGGSDAGGRVGDLAARVKQLVPEATVALIRGPFSDSDLPPGVEPVDAPPTLHELLAANDLVVTAAGQTMLEALCVGTPAVALIRAPNQRRQAESVAAAGAALISSEDELGDAIRHLSDDAGARRELTERGQEVIDGLGAHRVADRLLPRLGDDGFGFGGLRLRSAGPADSDFLFNLRNDPSAYPNFRSPHPVEPEEHADWLSRVLADPESDLLVIEDGGRAIGNIRLAPPRSDPAAVEIGISLVADARGRGTGRLAIDAAVAFGFVRRSAKLLLAAVRPANAASAAAFASAGFTRTGTDGELDVLTLERERFGWGSGLDG